MLCLIDGVRAQVGAQALLPNAALQSFASSHSEEMVTGDFFAHESEGGQTPLEQIGACGYGLTGPPAKAAENIGWGTGSMATPGQVLDAWMSSPEHRANLLYQGYFEVGVGVVAAVPRALERGTRGATYTVALATRQAR
jgi:uncharacterized protein YkwD